MLKQVTLYGELRENYGRNWSLDVNSPSEAMQALAANNPGFRQFVCSSHERGMGYKVMVGKTYIEKVEEIYDPSGKQEIKVVPVVLGAKKGGLGQILLGMTIMLTAPWMAAQASQIIAAGSMTAAEAAIAGGVAGASAPAATTAIGNMISGMAMRLGAGLVFGGIGMLLSPTPKSPGDDPENYGFNGVLNTTKQGVAIPVCYGQLMVGGAVISAGMKAEDY